MLMTANTPIRSPTRRCRHLALGLICLAGLLATPAEATMAGAAAAAGKKTSFTGQIVSGRGRYAKLRGVVRLVLGASSANGPPSPGKPGTFTFALTIRSPSCTGRVARSPRRCVSLNGTIRGTAIGTRVNPDVGASYALTGHGVVAPLGRVIGSGTTRGVGFIAHGRFPLDLELRNGAGAIVVAAQGPLVAGFSSPF